MNEPVRIFKQETEVEIIDTDIDQCTVSHIQQTIDQTIEQCYLPTIATTEDAISTWILESNRCGFRVTKNQIYDNVDLQRLDSKERSRWYQKFIQQHQRLRNIIDRAQPLARFGTINGWFENVQQIVSDTKCGDILNDPNRVFAFDEFCLFMQPTDKRILFHQSEASKNTPHSFGSNNYDECRTVSLGANAAGKVPPPVIFYNEKVVMNKMKTFSAYITKEFNPWLAKNGIFRPIVLFLDGHSPYLTIRLSEFCKSNGILLAAIPTDATPMLNPLHNIFQTNIKNEWLVERKKWEANNIRRFQRKDFPPMFGHILKSIGIKKLLVDAFRITGLCPFDVNAIESGKQTKETSDENLIPNVPQAAEDQGLKQSAVAVVTNNLDGERYEDDNSIEKKPNVEFLNISLQIGNLYPDLLKEFRQSDSTWKGDIKHTSLFEFWKKCQNACGNITDFDHTEANAPATKPNTTNHPLSDVVATENRSEDVNQNPQSSSESSSCNTNIPENSKESDISTELTDRNLNLTIVASEKTNISHNKSTSKTAHQTIALFSCAVKTPFSNETNSLGTKTNNNERKKSFDGLNEKKVNVVTPITRIPASLLGPIFSTDKENTNVVESLECISPNENSVIENVTPLEQLTASAASNGEQISAINNPASKKTFEQLVSSSALPEKSEVKTNNLKRKRSTAMGSPKIDKEGNNGTIECLEFAMPTPAGNSNRKLNESTTSTPRQRKRKSEESQKLITSTSTPQQKIPRKVHTPPSLRIRKSCRQLPISAKLNRTITYGEQNIGIDNISPKWRDKLEIGHFVIVLFENHYVPGRIEKMVGNFVHVNAMMMVGRSQWKFQIMSTLTKYRKSDILMEIRHYNCNRREIFTFFGIEKYMNKIYGNHVICIDKRAME